MLLNGNSWYCNGRLGLGFCIIKGIVGVEGEGKRG
tara:strand:+ start:48 stop:152 length:105 start_codon:yes stop_codon:yes gene_type:complete